MEVAVLSRQQWQSLLPVASDDRRRLATLLTAVHGQHAGLPIATARNWLSGGGLQARIRARLSQSLTRVHNSQPGNRGFTSDLRASFLEVVPESQLVMQVLVPLAWEACAAIGDTILFGETASLNANDAVARYENYTKAFDKAFESSFEPIQETKEEDNTFVSARPIFWDRVAFLLLSTAEAAADPHADTATNAGTNPSVDAGVLHFIKTLEPKFPNRMRSASHRVRNIQTTFRKVPLKQGGVRGIRQTRSLQDISDRLVSELVQPTFLQLERLLNSGFLVHHRPPPLDNRRNLLLVGLTLGPSDSSGPALAKSVWLDAAERLAVLLVRAGLEKSDLVHVTRFDDHAVTRVAVAVEHHREQRRELDAFGIGAHERLAMLRTHGWLPGFIDMLPGSSTPAKARALEDDAGGDPAFLRDLDQTLQSVFRDFPATAAGGGEREQVFDAYARIHFQVFLPSTLGAALEGGRLRFDRLCRRIGLPLGQLRNITVIVVPEGATSDFRILQAHRSASTIRGTDDAAGRDLNAVAADLSGTLISAALETIDA